MPLLANFNLPTRFGTNNPNKIDNPNVEAERKNNFGYQAYHSTIYDPFGNETPSSGGGGTPDNGDGNGSGEDVGIPDWADTPSEPLPLGDGTIFLLLITAIMITTIFIKQRKQKQIITQTNNNSDNNSTTQMTTRKQTYQSLRQKLFLLLAFVCVAGQANADRTIYFRPSTIPVGDNQVAWAKKGSNAWFPMLRVNNYGTTGTKTAQNNHYLSTYITSDILDETQSRFLKYTIYNEDTDGFAFYRVDDDDKGNMTTSYWKDKFCANLTATTVDETYILNCTPNNGWWDYNDNVTEKETCTSAMFMIQNFSDFNLIGIREGTWGTHGYGGQNTDGSWIDYGYYLAYYIENTAHCYFDNSASKWGTPMFARGKDVYSYKDPTTKLEGTQLYYTKLAGKSNIAYRKFLYIDNNTSTWEEKETFWKDYIDSYISKTDIDANKLETVVELCPTRSALMNNIKLDGTINLFTPATTNQANLNRQTITSYADLNKKLTLKVSSVGDGAITCNTYKLTGEGVSQSNTLTVSKNQSKTTGDAAYTADVTLIATPRTDYEFVGWYAGTNAESLISTEQTYKTTKTNSESTITAKFQPILISQTVAVETEGGGTGNIIRVSYSDGIYNRFQSGGTKIDFKPWMNSQYTVTVESIKEGYIFAGWYYNGELQSTNQSYSFTANIEGATITARFVLPQAEHAIALLTYDPTYNEYKPVNPGGSVTYTTKKANGSQLETVSCSTETATTFTAANNQTVTLSATAKTEYDFIGFYEGETLLAEGGEEAKAYTYSYTATTKGRYITARFAPKQCHPIILVPNSAGTYTIRFGMDKDKPENFYSKESSLTDTVITYAPYSYFYTVSSAKPILGYKFDHHDASPKSTNENYFPCGKFHNQAQTDTSYVVVSFLRDEDQVVYLDLNNGQWARDNYTTYWVYAYDTTNIYHKRDKKDNTIILRRGTYTWLPMTPITENSLYSCTIPRNKYSHIMFVQLKNDVLEAPTLTIESYKGQNLNTTKFFTIPATRMNCMKLKSAYNSSIGDGGGYEDMWTEPPTEVGDFRLVYIEQTAENQDNITEDYTFDDAGLIKKKANSLDTISLHIYNRVSDDGTIDGMNNPEILLQKCTAMVDNKWETIERRMIFGSLRIASKGAIKMPGRRNSNTATLVIDDGIDIIKDYGNDQHNGSGVWNFVISQDDAGNATILANETHRYNGDYYIRTTNAPGQYYQYTHPGNIMTYSAYAAANSDYTDYFIRYVDINEDGTPTAEAGKHPLVKFAIANDHSVYLNREFMMENKYGVDQFVVNKDGAGAPNLPADASVRFGWDRVTNHLTRAYIANTTTKDNEYLVVEGTNIGSPQGDAAYFTDNSNWLYSIDLDNATASAAAKVKAKMNGNYQYFVGTEQTNETLISGNGEGTYPIRLLYDFKDDRFTTIYHPQGTINGATDLQTPVMIEREHNNAPTQIVFEQSATIKATGTGEDQYTHPAYAVMTFLGNILTDPVITHHEKMFYWVSFPFDVKIKDIFGLGNYGKYWIMQEYNGAQRAQHGLKYTNWQYITNTGATLYANTGYVICLNYGQLVTDGIVTKDNKVSLYFPSCSAVSPADIQQQDPVTVKLKEWEAGTNIAWNHLNWHLIGVPSFATPEFTRETTELPFLYEYWHPTDGYAAIANGEEGDLLPMHSYMVQYAGDITWESVVNTSTPQGLAAKASAEDKPVMLRLELQQAGSTLDKTYVQLRNDKGTKSFDLNLDLSKIINAGANIYSVVNSDQMAGNAMPKVETVLPIGVVISAAGEYTFAMPKGTEGILVELIDYEQGTSTNLLLGDYTITLPKGTFDQRFALRLVPDKVATSMENIGGANGEKQDVRKYIIDGLLYLQQGQHLYDAQGHRIQ